MNTTGDPAASDDHTPEAETLARPYRSKKQKPCDACRIRRTGCIVEATALKCSLCQHRGIPCTFLSKPVRKRERQARPDQPRSSSSTETMQPDRIAFALTMPALSSTPLLRLRSAVDTSQTSSMSVPHNDTAAMLSGYTSLYSGASGDQDPNLLRHLNFDKNDHFSHASWTVWKVLPRASNPVYFTLFSNDLMDQHTDMYNTESIDNIVGPHQAQLLDLYYTHVHHSYLILEPRQDLERRINEKSIRLSLLTCIYCIAMAFQDSLEGVNKEKRYDLCMFAFSILNIEARAPNLDVIKAFLLYMHMLPALVREPNRPGDWALTCQLVGVAQDIGLHRDPSDWKIPAQERKTRRILWWALFIHEKWTAHWLGRPSHIRNTDWDVRPLSLDDFSDDASRLDLNCLASAETFIALASLSEILGDILETFYSVCKDFSVMDAFLANIEGERLRNRWLEWEATTRVVHSMSTERTNGRHITSIHLIICKLTIPYYSIYVADSKVYG